MEEFMGEMREQMGQIAAQQAVALQQPRTTGVPPPSFSGGEDEDLVEWLSMYDHVANINGWDGERKCQFLYVALSGAARQWYAVKVAEGPPATWDAWVEQLRKSFKTDNVKEMAHLRLRQRVQMPAESAEKYYYDIIQLCARVDSAMTEGEKVRILMRGMRPDFLEKIMLFNPQTAEEVLTKLQQITRTTLMMSTNSHFLNASYPVNMAQGTGLSHGDNCASRPTPGADVFFQQQTEQASKDKMMKQIIDTMERLCDRLERLDFSSHPRLRQNQPFPRQTSRTVSGNPRCYNCGRSGHTARFCRSPRRSGQQYTPQDARRQEDGSDATPTRQEEQQGNGLPRV